MVTRYLIIDTETTGLDPLKGGHRLIELACLEYLYSKPTGNVFNLTLNPEGKKSTSSAFKIHRIKNEDLIGQPTFKEVLDKFIKLATDAHIIAFNAPFDIKFLNSELVKAAHTSTLQDISSAISCAMELAKSKFNISRISLDNACLRYGINTSHRETHSALTDAKLCAQLYFKLIDNAEKPLKRSPQ